MTNIHYQINITRGNLALLSCRSLKQSIICVSFRKKSNVQHFLTNVSYSGGDLLDKLCYVDSNTIQSKYFLTILRSLVSDCRFGVSTVNYPDSVPEPKGHLKQAIKKSTIIISIIITHHFNRMTYRLTLWCPMVFERRIKPAKIDWMKLSKRCSHVHCNNLDLNETSF